MEKTYTEIKRSTEKCSENMRVLKKCFCYQGTQKTVVKNHDRYLRDDLLRNLQVIKLF